MNEEKLLDDGIVTPLEYHPMAVGSGLRFANNLIDTVAFYLVFLVFTTLTLGLGIFLSLPLFIAYYAVLEATTGKTLGKMLTGCKVITETGEKPDFGTALLRTIIRVVPFEAFSIFFGDDGRMWHDRWAKTYVVKDENR